MIGLDRDGVINEDLKTYCTCPSMFKPIVGSLEAIIKLYYKGYKVVVITNQGAVEKGLMTTADVDNLHKHMYSLLNQVNPFFIDAVYYSTSSRSDDPYAKPNIGMFKLCEKEHTNIAFNQGYYVGDKLTDLKAALNIGAKPILVRTGYGLDTEQELNKTINKTIKEKTTVFNNLADFVDKLK